jgi:ERCC4-type nuclease
MRDALTKRSSAGSASNTASTSAKVDPIVLEEEAAGSDRNSSRTKLNKGVSGNHRGSKNHDSIIALDTSSDEDEIEEININLRQPPAKRTKFDEMIGTTNSTTNNPANISSSSNSSVAKPPHDLKSNLIRPKIMIICVDERQSQQISSVVQKGCQMTMLESYMFFLSQTRDPVFTKQKSHMISLLEAIKPEGVVRGMQAKMVNTNGQSAGSVNAGSVNAGGANAGAENETDAGSGAGGPDFNSVSSNSSNTPLVEPEIDVCLINDVEDRLYAFEPDVAIIMEPNCFIIRCVEAYAVAREREISLNYESFSGVGNSKNYNTTKSKLTVYLLALSDSVELFKYESTLQKESKSLEFLVAMKRRFVADIGNYAGKKLVLYDDPEDMYSDQSSRHGGRLEQQGGNARTTPTIIVDMREFNSRLPFYLHQKHTLFPATITIGDYILSRDICVERKAIFDLIQSLMSGRLLTQAENLCAAYSTPTLLIEWESISKFLNYGGGPSYGNGSFGSNYALPSGPGGASSGSNSGGGTQTNNSKNNKAAASNKSAATQKHFNQLAGYTQATLVRQKLIVLLLQFPSLRVIWSPNYPFTAKMFSKLKKNRHEPTVPGSSSNSAKQGQIASTMNQHVSFVGGPGSSDSSSGSSSAAPPDSVTNSLGLEALRRLPGITHTNLFSVAKRIKSIADLATKTEDELAEILEVPKSGSATTNTINATNSGSSSSSSSSSGSSSSNAASKTINAGGAARAGAEKLYCFFHAKAAELDDGTSSMFGEDQSMSAGDEIT